MSWLREMLAQTPAGRQALVHAAGRRVGIDRLHRAYRRRALRRTHHPRRHRDGQ